MRIIAWRSRTLCLPRRSYVTNTPTTGKKCGIQEKLHCSNDGVRPDAINTIVGTIRSLSSTDAYPRKLANALLILLHAVKELSSARLQRSRTALQSATPEIVAVLAQLYVSKVRTWEAAVNSGSIESVAVSHNVYHSLLAIKTIRRLLVSGYEHPNRDDQVSGFWSLTFDNVGFLIDSIDRQSASLPPGLAGLIEKHLQQLAKLHLEMARSHPAAFVLLPSSLQLVRAYWGVTKQFSESWGSRESTVSAINKARISSTGDQSDERPTQEKLSLRGLLLIRACIKMVFSPTQTFKYKHPEDKAEQKQAEQMVASELLTTGFIEELMQVIITKFFVFRESDLREWENEPEDWELSQENESEGYEFSIRACSEKLFLDLAINYKNILVPPLLSVFQSFASMLHHSEKSLQPIADGY